MASPAAPIVVLVVAALLLAPVGVRGEDGVHGSANLAYKVTETTIDGDKQTEWYFGQIYKLGLRKDLTPRLNLAADLGVSEAETKEGKSTTVSPDLRLALDNEFFDAGAGYRLTEKDMDFLTLVSDRDPQRAETWNLDLVTRMRDYPRLRLWYSEDTYEDYLEVHETDSKQTKFIGSLDYDYRFANAGYTFTRGTVDDFAGDVVQETRTHAGRGSFGESFFEDKLSTAGSFNFSRSRKTVTTQSQANTVSIMRLALHGLHEASDPAAGQPLGTDDTLIDGDRDTSTGINIGGAANTGQHLGLDLKYATAVEQLELFTQDTDFSPSAFVWDVYTSEDNIDWSLATASASHSYDEDKDKFTITFPSVGARYIKIVNRANDAAVSPIYVTELEAMALSTQPAYTTEVNRSCSTNGQMDLGYRITDWLSVRYSGSEDRQRNEPDSVESRRNTHTTSARAEHRLHDYLFGAAQIQRRWETDSTARDKTSDNAMLQLHSDPLDTLGADLSLNHVVTRTETNVQSRSVSSLLHLAARLLEGADLDTDLALTRYDNVASSTVTDSKSLDNGLSLELLPSLTAECHYDVMWSRAAGRSRTTRSHRTLRKLGLFWRPADDLYARTSHSVDRDEMNGAEEVLDEFNVNWLPTRKIQVGAGLTLAREYAPDAALLRRHAFTSDLTWNLSRTMSLGGKYEFSRQESDVVIEVQTYSLTLSAKF